VISQKAPKLILDAEGLNQPGRWPGGASGITLGFGYDLGHVHPEELRQDWRGHLAPEILDRLAPACFLRGRAAAAAAPRLADITVTRAAAVTVFLERSLPLYERRTREAFGPGLELLPPDAQGALCSLVYNRGDHLVGDRRREMRAIRESCDRLSQAPNPEAVHAACTEIAGALRAMKRLWVGQGLDGLLARREAEARLVEQAGLPSSASSARLRKWGRCIIGARGGRAD
jgi:GH24 family phage-related lysozyme (muramidase)